MLEIIINEEESKKNIILLENGIMIERHEEHCNQKRLEGNIYCGKIENVIKGMQAGFIDIGESKNAFIRIKDLLPKIDESKLSKEEINNFQEEQIGDLIKSGDSILVQVKRDGTRKKRSKSFKTYKFTTEDL